MDRRAGAAVVLTIAACGGRLRLAEGSMTSAAVSDHGHGGATWTCAIEAAGTWVSVTLTISNGGDSPIEWPDPVGGPRVVIHPAEDCVIEVEPLDSPHVSHPHGVVAPGETRRLVGGFAVVASDDAPWTTWRGGPAVALPPGKRCAVVCTSVYFPADHPPLPPDADPRRAWFKPFVPITAEAGTLYVTTSRPRRLALELPAEVPDDDR